MFLHQSAYLDQYLYGPGYPRQMHQEENMQHRDEKYVNTHMWLGNWRFGNVEIRKCCRLRRVVSRAPVISAVASADCSRWAEVWIFRCVSSVFADSLRCHCDWEGIHPCGFDKASPGAFVSQRSPLMRRKLNIRHRLFSDLCTRIVDQTFCFLYHSAQQPSFGHSGHIQGQAHVGLFQLYPTSLPCHSSRHVEYLQEISCCF